MKDKKIIKALENYRPDCVVDLCVIASRNLGVELTLARAERIYEAIQGRGGAVPQADGDGTSGQDRESYTDTQDRESYAVDDPVTRSFDQREVDTIIAALRLFQRPQARIADGDGMIADIAEEHGEALTDTEVDRLIEKIQFN